MIKANGITMNNEEYTFIPPAPFGEDRGGITESEYNNYNAALGDVSQLKEDLVKLEDYVDMPFGDSKTLPVMYNMQTYIDDIPMKKNTQYKIKATISNSVTQAIYIYLRDRQLRLFHVKVDT